MREENRPYRIYVTGMIAIAGNIQWQIRERPIWDDGEEGLFIKFPLFADVKKRNALKPIKNAIEQNNIDWLKEDAGHWLVDLDKLFAKMTNLHPYAWLSGIVEPEIEIETEEREVFEKKRETHVQFIITRKEIDLCMPKKIFLSHKGIDKPKVRDYFNILKSIGFNPWLDEDAMVAGVPLERALLDGMKESCASVFFVTPKYEDDNYLASEINYAMAQKRDKGDRFSIITLVLKDDDGNKGEVPELLKQYVWKEPSNDLKGLQEIIRALPIEVKNIAWK